MDWFLSAVKRYADFRGRAGRPEFCYFCLLCMVISLFLGLLDDIAGTHFGKTDVGILWATFQAATFLPTLSVGVRRLHDTDRNGWWLLFVLVPIIGWIVIIAVLLAGSDSDANRYGEGPQPAA